MLKINFDKPVIDTIIQLYNSGISCKEIGKKFNCSKQTINRILKENNQSIRDYSHCRRKYTINENIFENIDTIEKAYWLGILAGDGTVDVNNKISLSLQIKDKDHIFKFRDFLESNHPITKINCRNKKDGSPSISYSISFYNKKISRDLYKLGIVPNKTKGMLFPKLNDNVLPGYMLGLVDSDGCFCLKHKKLKKPTLCFSFVGHDDFIEVFQNILIDKCNVSKTKIDKHLSTPYIGVVTYGGYKNILPIVKYLYDQCPIFLSRKKNIAVNYLLNIFPNDIWLKNASFSQETQLSNCGIYRT